MEQGKGSRKLKSIRLDRIVTTCFIYFDAIASDQKFLWIGSIVTRISPTIMTIRVDRHHSFPHARLEDQGWLKAGEDIETQTEESSSCKGQYVEYEVEIHGRDSKIEEAEDDSMRRGERLDSNQTVFQESKNKIYSRWSNYRFVAYE